MNSPRVDNLLKLVGTARDGALLRFALGSALLESTDAAAAIVHLGEAVSRDPSYSAAWQRLGEAQLGVGDTHAAAESWRRGIAAAEARGDKQAAKVMAVFLRRLERQTPAT